MIRIPDHIEPAGFGTAAFLVEHGLADHRLFTEAGIAELADRMPPGSAELGTPNDVDLGLDYEPPPMFDAPAAIADLGSSDRSVYLYNIERLPEVGRLIASLLRSVYPTFGIDPSDVDREEGYLFLTGGPATTGAHVDHEYNLLLVLRGHKRVFVADVPTAEAEEALAAMYTGGYGSCASAPKQMREFVVGPGQGVFIPPRAAHYVHSGPEPCSALSVVFSTASLVEEGRIYRANALIARLGMTPRPPGERPLGDRAKLLGLDVARVVRAVARPLRSAAGRALPALTR